MLRTDGDPELRVFDPAIRFLHWLTLFLIVAVFLLAVSIDFASSKAEAAAFVQLHRSFGICVWFVTLGRLVWRQFSRFPNWPADMPELMRFAAHWSEYALYALLLSQPILGLLHTNAHGDRLNLFFLGDLPAVVGNVGAAERMNYTALGNSVNLAARLEGLNKEYGTTILVIEAVRERAEYCFRFK